MKTFYQDIRDPQKMLDDHSSTLEEVFVPAEVLTELSEMLKRSTKILPPIARRFQEWEVGLLSRLDRSDQLLPQPPT